LCSAYVAAIADFRYRAGIDSIANAKNNAAEACVPDNYPLTKMVSTLRQYIISHPYVKNLPSVDQVIEEALSDSYPC
jgi:hypothetical protein